MSEPFGFVVRHEQVGDDPAGWKIYLPHQCQEWFIAGEKYGAECAPHAVAVAELERFIAEAQQALAALRAGRPYGRDEWGDA